MKPPKSVLHAFDISSTSVEHLKGGQGTTYRAGDLILKPVANEVEANWIAEVYTKLEPTSFRIPRPISTISGNWLAEGWSAWTFIQGNTVKGVYTERFEVCRAFHRALIEFGKPDFLQVRSDPWSQADRIVWEGAAWQPHPKVAAVYKILVERTKPLDLPEQIIHGDISGNMLHAAYRDLAIIDFSPYWRPATYAEALLVVDVIMWEGAPWSVVELIEHEETAQLILRAVMRRLVEVDRHCQLGKLPERYLEQVDTYANFTEQLLSNLF